MILLIQGNQVGTEMVVLKLLYISIAVQIEDTNLAIVEGCGLLNPYEIPVMEHRLHAVSINIDTERSGLWNVSRGDHFVIVSVKEGAGAGIHN